jgi:hypothetical protein
VSKPSFGRSARAVFRTVLLVVLLLALTACAGLPKQQTYNREANASIKTIAVLPMRETELQLMLLNSPAANFGLIGGLIAEADRASKQKRMREDLATAKFNHVELFKQAFTEEMSKHGYTLVWPEQLVETAKSSRDGNSLRKAYTAVSNADAQLDLNFGFVGYGASGVGANSPYRPTAVVVGQMVSADGKTKLFTETVVYHNLFNTEGAIVLPPDEHFSYPKFHDLEAAGAKKAEGLAIAVQSVAKTLADQL